MTYQHRGEDTLSTTEVCREIGVYVTVETIKELNIKPEAVYHTGVFWRRSDIPEICFRLGKKLTEKAIATKGETNATSPSKNR